MHKLLYSHMDNPLAGRTKNVQNHISVTYADGRVETLFTRSRPYETPEALERICEEYSRVIGNMELEPLIAIPVFIHDFLCIHPFNDGNGRMSRLLTTLLLYKSGFTVGRYISLEAKIAKDKGLYYDALAARRTGGMRAGKTPSPSSNTSSALSSPLTGISTSACVWWRRSCPPWKWCGARACSNSADSPNRTSARSALPSATVPSRALSAVWWRPANFSARAGEKHALFSHELALAFSPDIVYNTPVPMGADSSFAPSCRKTKPGLLFCA